jgi:hypothetical protein
MRLSASARFFKDFMDPVASYRNSLLRALNEMAKRSIPALSKPVNRNTSSETV